MATLLIAFSPWNWLLRLGPFGLILIGIVDASFVPLPGSIDVFTIFLAAGKRELWWLYAIAATVGAVLGGYFTYKIGKKGGKEALEKKFPKQKLEKVYKKFEKGGFGTIFVAALLPPPIPMVPFVLAAGALEYPTRKFLSSLTCGRAVRYFTVAFLAKIYGQQIIGWARQYYQPILWTVVGLAVLGAIGGLIFYFRKKKGQRGAKIQHDAAA